MKISQINGKFFACVLAGAAALAAVPDRAEAATYNYAFAGTWNQVQGGGDLNEPSQNGAFSGSLSISDNVAAGTCAPSPGTCYAQPSGLLSVSTAGATYSTTLGSALEVGSLNDTWWATNNNPAGAVNNNPTGPGDSLTLLLQFFYSLSVEGNILPDFAGSDWNMFYLDYNYNLGAGPGFVALGTVTSFEPMAAVPVPAALPLFATGISGLVCYSWRRKQKSAQAA